MDVEVDRDARQCLELTLEIGDVEPGDLPYLVWRDGRQQIKVTAILIITSSRGAEQHRRDKSVGFNQPSDSPGLSLDCVRWLHGQHLCNNQAMKMEVTSMQSTRGCAAWMNDTYTSLFFLGIGS